MVVPLVAHAGGWDEVAVFVVPVLGYWLLQRRRRAKAARSPQPEPSDGEHGEASNHAIDDEGREAAPSDHAEDEPHGQQ